MECRVITLNELDAVLRQAKVEGWRGLALLGPYGTSEWIAEQPTDPDLRAFQLNKLFFEIPLSLLELRDLTSLNLIGHKIGEAGARAIAEGLRGLTSLGLGLNNIGEGGTRAIAEGLRGLTSLDLNCNNIGEAGARALAEGLRGLTSLNLNSNNIGDAGARALAEGLSGLTSLDLYNNNIGEAGARALAKELRGLTSLNLGYNKIGDTGARALAKELRGLASLNLYFNNIGVAGARAIAEGLRGLTSLNLNGNNISNAGVRAIAERLSCLTSLHLRNNKLTALPRELLQLTQLRYLDVRDNPQLNLPPELTQTTDASAILDYLRRLTTETRRRLNEAKLLLVGQGGVGKTSLARYLIDRQKRVPGEARTDGVVVRDWSVVNAEHAQERIRLNTWDFGGQEIMHATHQFFLTKRSLYLLVLDARKSEQDGNLRYWLDVICGLGGGSPVIVVVNQCDGGNDLKLNESRLRLDYPNIASFVRTSCETGQGIEELRRKIAHEVNGLPNAREEWPQSWFQIKNELAEAAAQAHHLEYAAYAAITARHEVTRPEEQVNVLRFLHDLGVVLYYDDDSAYDPRLRQRMILDPGWVTHGVYRVLTSQKLCDTKGVMTIADLMAILSEKQDGFAYDTQGCDFILGMMEKFELCFDYPESKKQLFLVPERLDEMEPPLDWERSDALRFQVSYSVLPSGVIPRLITRTSTLHSQDPGPWRSGVVLRIEGCEVFIRGDREGKLIHVNVPHGDPNARRRALAVVRYALREINATLPGIETKELVPLPEEPDVVVEYDYLLELERDGDEEFRPAGAKKRYRVRELLDGVGVLDESPNIASVTTTISRRRQ